MLFFHRNHSPKELSFHHCSSSRSTFSTITLVVLGVLITTSVALVGHQILGNKASHFYQTLGKKIVAIPIIASLSTSYLAYLILHFLYKEKEKGPTAPHPFLEEGFNINAPRKEAPSPKFRELQKQENPEIQNKEYLSTEEEHSENEGSQIHPLESDFNSIFSRENSTSVQEEAPSPKFPELQEHTHPELYEEEYWSLDGECLEVKESQVPDIPLEKQAIIDSLDTWINKPQNFFNLYLVHVYKDLRNPSLSEKQIAKRKENVSMHLTKIKEIFVKKIREVETLKELEELKNDIQEAIGFPLFLLTRVIFFIKKHPFPQIVISGFIKTIKIRWIETYANRDTARDFKENKFSIYTPRFQQTEIPQYFTDFIYESLDVLATIPMYRENFFNQKIIQSFVEVFNEVPSKITMIPTGINLIVKKINWEVPNREGDLQLIQHYQFFKLYDKIEAECFDRFNSMNE